MIRKEKQNLGAIFYSSEMELATRIIFLFSFVTQRDPALSAVDIYESVSAFVSAICTGIPVLVGTVNSSVGRKGSKESWCCLVLL